MNVFQLVVFFRAGLAVFQQPLPLLRGQPQAARQLLAHHHVLFLLELNDLGQLALGELGQALQKGDVKLVVGSHRARIRKSLLASKMTMFLYTAPTPSSRRTGPAPERNDFVLADDRRSPLTQPSGQLAAVNSRRGRR